MLGVLDWGIGGLGLVAALRARGHRTPVAYLSDAGFPPYGTVPAAVLRDRIQSLGERLVAEGCSAFVLACNAASTVRAELDLPVPVHGVIAAGIRAALEGPGRIGVVGGLRTVESGLHACALRAAGREVRAAVAQPWSALVERGCLEGAEVEAAVDAVLEELGTVERLLLACTHYPALSPLLARRLPGVVLVDPVETVVSDLEAAGLLGGEGLLQVRTSGDAGATVTGARRAWRLHLGEVGRLDLSGP